MEKQIPLTFKKLTQGERMYILVFRARSLGLKTPDCAKGIGVSETYLAALFHRESLTMRVIKNASDFFGVPPEFFDDDQTLKELVQQVNTLMRDRQLCINENKTLREDMIIMKAEIIRLRRAAGIDEEDDDAPNHN